MRRINFWGNIIFLALVLLACSSGPFNATRPRTLADIKKSGKLIVGTAITKPFEFYDPVTHELIGFDVELADYIGAQLGVTVEFVEMPFAALIPTLEAGKVDLIIAAIYIKLEREELVDFSTPYMDTGLVVVTRPEQAGKIHSVNDLNNLRVGVKSGSTGDNLARDLLAQGLTLERVEYKETLDSFAALEANQLDVVLNDYLNTLFYLKDTGSKMQIVRNEVNDVFFLSKTGLGIAVKQGNDDLLAEINVILEQARNDGAYDRLYEKWLGEAR